MRFLVSVILLMVQFGPLAGAGMCMYAAAQPKSECSMPMQGVPHDKERPHSTSPHDCAQMVVCAPTAPVVPEVAVHFFGINQLGHTNYSTPGSLFSGDPIAPPEPPPIV